MDNFNVTIFMKNSKYGQSLARGLCNEGTGLNVFFAENIEEAEASLQKGILLTDYNFESKKQIITFGNKEGISNNIDKTSSLKDIINKIKKTFYEDIGISYFPDIYEKMTIIGVASREGGIGVTSIAMTLARFMSAKTEEKVLYLNFSLLDDYGFYLDMSFNDVLSKMQYVYMKENQIRVCVEEFCLPDSWNVYYFKPETDRNCFFNEKWMNRIIDYIGEEKLFSYIVIDFGKTSNLEDKRLDTLLEIQTRGENCEFRIPFDDEAFVKYDNYIDILTASNFGQVIEKIAAEIIK